MQPECRQHPTAQPEGLSKDYSARYSLRGGASYSAQPSWSRWRRNSYTKFRPNRPLQFVV